MTTGKYFNRGVMALDAPYIGHVIRETADKIVVFGGRNDRYDIPKSEIQMTGRNVLIGLKLDEIANKYKVKYDEPLPTTVPLEHWTQGENIDLATYERKYPKSLFNKGVRVLNEEHVGHVMKETDREIVIFGSYGYRFDVPKSKIKEVGRNVILNMDFPELASKYKVDRDAPLPTGEPIEKINDEAYPEVYYQEEGKEKEHKNHVTNKSIANMIMSNDNSNKDYSKNSEISSSSSPPAAI